MTSPLRTTTPDERATLRREVDAAPLVAIPEADDHTRGTLLDVRSVGILPEPVTAYIRTMAGQLYRLPDLFVPWAESLIAVHVHNAQHHVKDALLPATIEFGTIDGRAMAELVDFPKKEDTP